MHTATVWYFSCKGSTAAFKGYTTWYFLWFTFQIQWSKRYSNLNNKTSFSCYTMTDWDRCSKASMKACYFLIIYGAISIFWSYFWITTEFFKGYCRFLSRCYEGYCPQESRQDGYQNYQENNGKKNLITRITWEKSRSPYGVHNLNVCYWK